MALTSKFWKKYFEVYDYLNLLIPYSNTLDVIVNTLQPKEGDIVLDAGSGTGNLSILLSKRGTSVISIDNSPEGLELHKRKSRGASVSLVNLMDKLPFPTEHFDGICVNNVIYTIHKSHRQKLFDEFYRVLKNSGKIVVSDICVGFSPWKIYASHFKNSLKSRGFMITLSQVLTLVVPTIKIFYYNYLIKKENHRGSYSFVGLNDHKDLLNKSMFRNISPNIRVYANQAILNWAIK